MIEGHACLLSACRRADVRQSEGRSVMIDHTSLESLRKEAKRWLKALRAGEAHALARLEKVLPRHSTQPGLREVQQALAREHGFASWAELKEHVATISLDR